MVKVINVSSKDRKIGLSIKALDGSSEKDSLQDYKKKQAAGPSTIGDLLKTEMESKETADDEAPEVVEEPVADAAAEETPEVAEEPVADAAAEETLEVTEESAIEDDATEVDAAPESEAQDKE